MPPITSRIQLLKTMPYSDYLRSEHWQSISYAAKQRAGFACQLCNGKQNLQTHHRTYERRGHEADADLIVLCEACHKKHHGLIAPKPQLPVKTEQKTSSGFGDLQSVPANPDTGFLDEALKMFGGTVILSEKL